MVPTARICAVSQQEKTEREERERERESEKARERERERERKKRERKREKARKTESKRERERERERKRETERERERERDTKRQREWFAKSATQQEIGEGGVDQTGSMTTRKRPPTWRCLGKGDVFNHEASGCRSQACKPVPEVKPKSLNSTFEKEVPLV